MEYTGKRGFLYVILLILLVLCSLGASASYDCGLTSIRCVNDQGTAEYATIQAAVDAIANPGDIVVIESGTYTLANHIKVDDVDGTAGSPITIIGNGTTKPFINGTLTKDNIPRERGVIFIDNVDYYIIENLEIIGGNTSGIRVSLSNFTTVRNITSHDNQVWGIFTDFSYDYCCAWVILYLCTTG